MTAVVTPAAPSDELRPEQYPQRRYDLVKEFLIAMVVVTVLTFVLAGVFSSPDDKPATIAGWARATPQDFVATALTELDGTSGTAGYGPPYNSASDGQKIGPVSLQKLGGVHIPIDTADAFVLQPLDVLATSSPALRAELARWRAASPSQQAAWTDAYTKALDQAQLRSGELVVPRADSGPVAPMMTALLGMARSGALDGALVTKSGFYNDDYTKPLLLLGDGSYLSDRASQQHLWGDQWGMMNEVGNYPGQAWLWLYTTWYQVPPFNTSANADALIWGIMAVLTAVLVFVPFIPGVRSLPKVLPVHRLIWRRYDRS
jgi:hypothetical protein